MALFKTIQASLYLIVVWSRMVEEENQVQDEAVKATRQSLAVAMNQYEAGILSYFNNPKPSIGHSGRKNHEQYQVCPDSFLSIFCSIGCRLPSMALTPSSS